MPACPRCGRIVSPEELTPPPIRVCKNCWAIIQEQKRKAAYLTKKEEQSQLEGALKVRKELETARRPGWEREEIRAITICPHCGTENAATREVCYNCGKKLR